MGLVALLLLAAGVGSAAVDPQKLVRESIANGERSWKLSRQYACEERDTEEQLDSNGDVKSREVTVSEVVPVGGVPFERALERNGQPVSSEERRKQDERLKKLQSESPEEREKQLAKDEQERAFMKEVPDAFEFKLVGDERLPTGDTWVLEATPRPGFRSHSRYGKAFRHLSGKLWIDKKDVQWVKAEAEATETVSFGWILARVAKGSHITFEQTRLPDGNWVPEKIQTKASARTMLVKNRRFQDVVTYSNYRKVGQASAAGFKPAPHD